MAITLRIQKGSALTYSELDGNFTELDDRAALSYVADSGNNLSYANGTYDFGSNIIKYANAVDQEADLANYDPGTYHGMTMHVHSTGGLYYAHAGAWRKLLTDTSHNNVEGAGYVDPLSDVAFDGDYNSLSNTPTVPANIGDLSDVSVSGATNGQVLKYDGTNWVPATDATADSGSGIALTDLSVSVQTAGSANLAYDNSTGVFSYTPPDLSSYALSSSVPATLLDLNIVDGSNGQVLSTDGAGNFSFTSVSGTSSYTDGDVDTHLNQSSANAGEVLGWNGSDYAWIDPDAAEFSVVNNGSSDYTFSDADNHWFPTAENDPVLYLRRGETYIFNVNASGHPFEIRVSNGGSAYNTGVTGNGSQVGQVVFNVPMSAPSTLYYQCTVHSAMGNTINIV